MHFLAYIPGPRRPGLLAGVGLPELAAGAHYTALERGPDGQRGTLITWPTPHRPCPPRFDERHLTDPDGSDQIWAPAVEAAEGALAAGRYWIGIDRARPPSEEDLRRPRPVPSVAVRMNDGGYWLLPLIDQLPGVLVPRRSGVWETLPSAEHAPLLASATIWRRVFEDFDSGATLSLGDLAEFVTSGLALNYRITREVVGLLRLFSRDQGAHLFEAARRMCGCWYEEGSSGG